MQDFIGFRATQEITDAIDRLKQEYQINSESELLRKLILNCDQLLSNKESEYKKLLEIKDNEIKALHVEIGELQAKHNQEIEVKDQEIKALYVKIGELKGQSEIKTLLINIQKELNKPLWRRIFG